jgi:hypothetical protein
VSDHASNPEPPGATQKPDVDSQSIRLTQSIYWTVSAILVFIALILTVNLWVQYGTYRAAVASSLSGLDTRELVGALVFTRAWDFAVVKTCSLFLAFILIFLGALYVLRQGEQGYRARIDSGLMKATLQSSSPGLVLATLGVVLVIAVLFSATTISVESQAPAAPNERLQPAPRLGETKDLSK